MDEGFQLLVVGLGVVFLFLGLLVLAVRLLARFAGTTSAGPADDTTVPMRRKALVAIAIAVADKHARQEGGGSGA